MDSFRFCPELFEIRTQVIATLDDAGFQWLSHFSAVDPLHDVYGIEVCGIREHDDAASIRALLVQSFPSWRYRRMCHKDYGREPGFTVSVFRDSPPEPERWESV